jgi:DNA-binding response OmpR family regulator
VLRFLAARSGEVVRRHELLEEVWGSKDYITMRTVDNHVASLRAKLEEKASNPRHLLTMRGMGYKFVP